MFGQGERAEEGRKEKGDNERKNAGEKAFHVIYFCFLIEGLKCCPYPAILNFQLLMKTWWLEKKIPS